MAGSSAKARIRRIRKRTWVLIGGAATVVLAGGTAAAVILVQQPSAQAAPATQTVAASLETLETTIESTGTLTPAVQESASFAVSGTVTSVAVAAGDTVTEGQTLATVDTLTVVAELAEANAQLADAAAQLATAQESADGTDASNTQIAAREANVAVAQEAVETAEEAVAGATLAAPAAGLVTSVSLEVGDTVSSSSSGTGSSNSTGSGSTGSGSTGSGSTGSGSTGSAGASGSTTTADSSSGQFTIVGTDAWTVEVSLGETDVTDVEEGDQVELATDDGDELFGVVDEVGVLPSTSSGSASYPVDITLTGDVEGVYDGTSVTATIITERRTDVLTVPSAAVTTAEDGAAIVTVVDAAGNETETAVEVGETSGSLTEITDGLAEGDEVLVTVFTPGSGNTDSEGGAGQQMGDGEMTFPGGGEMPSGGFGGGEMPSGGQMPSGGFGGQN
ncbi:biotin/lipoyl-binding protein [Leucobacter allii]|uniref:efflux RND transporter periplasmic adaptor subunit n=1 Tax=Leucobacter allii TaxID=2932247 RepID=UPI001FD2BE5B|nr:biotin/lipoyl-binding protein [Leucobacter allii]UOR02325.1 biotin/lipoyl-binding protein [Leucobacter allii]